MKSCVDQAPSLAVDVVNGVCGVLWRVAEAGDGVKSWEEGREGVEASVAGAAAVEEGLASAAPS